MSDITVVSNLPSESTIHTKLAEVALAIDNVAKRGRNDFHKYDYATEADISAAVRYELASRGVTFQVVDVDPVESQSFTTDKGDRILTAIVTARFIDSGSNTHVDVKTLAQGGDKGDKAGYKLMTGAVKYALLKTFLIPTGDDPETANPGYSDKVATASAKPLASRGMVKKAGGKKLSDLGKKLSDSTARERVEAASAKVDESNDGEAGGTDYVSAAILVAEAGGRSGEAMGAWIKERKDPARSIKKVIKSAAESGADREVVEKALTENGLQNLIDVFDAVEVTA